MRKTTVFRGCTRPPMFMGVPYVPFVVGTGACLLLAMYINLYCLLALPAVIFAMRLMARHDEHIFHLLGLHWAMRLKIRNRQHYDGQWYFSALGERRAERGHR